MEESVLTSIKKLLGFTEDYTEFDEDIIMNINSAFFALNQVGAIFAFGKKTITDSTSKWNDIFEDNVDLSGIRLYVYYKTRLSFDPPASSAHLEAIKSQLSELEWRINFENELKEQNNEQLS